jgi:dihydroorotase
MMIDLCGSLGSPEQGADHAAKLAGFSTVCLRQGFEDPIHVEHALKKPRAVQVACLAALTVGANNLNNLSTLKNAGCVGATQGLQPLHDPLILRRALAYAASVGLTVHVVPFDDRFGGCAHEGAVATRLGLAGIPISAETLPLQHWLSAVEDTGARVHFGRITSAAGVALIAEAKQRGLPITADVAVPYLLYTDQHLAVPKPYHSQFHVLPPLRTLSDQAALWQGLRSGVVDALVSDHRAVSMDGKTQPFPLSETGMESYPQLSLVLKQLSDEVLRLCLSENPRKILQPSR